MRRNSFVGAAVLVTVFMTATGCDDPKVRIAVLEEENHSLASELERMRNESDGMRRNRDNCQADLLTMRQANSDLMAQLASRPEPQAPPVTMTAKPDLPGEWQTVQGGAMIAIEGSVLFRPGKAVLRPESKTMLGRLGSELNAAFNGRDVYVFGHTDSDPIRKSGWKDNRELSMQRALAVVRYLQSQGVAPDRLVACGWGEHRPVASNTSDDGKKRNRRVEIFAADASLASVN